MKIGDLKVNVKLSFWSALKMRLAGIRSFEEKVGQISRKYTFSKNGLIVTEYYLNKEKLKTKSKVKKETKKIKK